MINCKAVDTSSLNVKYKDTQKDPVSGAVLERTATFTLPACGKGSAHEITIKADLKLGGVKVQVDGGPEEELLYSGRNNFSPALGNQLDCKIGSVDADLRAGFFRKSLEIHDTLGVQEQNPDTLSKKMLVAASMPATCIRQK